MSTSKVKSELLAAPMQDFPKSASAKREGRLAKKLLLEHCPVKLSEAEKISKN